MENQNIRIHLKAYDNKILDLSTEEIVNTEPEFVEAIGLSQHLSPTRANGLASMLQRLKADAANLLKNS